jgi:hypothetical protein
MLHNSSVHIILYCSVLGRKREYWRALQIPHHKGTTSSQMGGLRITGICWYLVLFWPFVMTPLRHYSKLDGCMYMLE